jgi:hypothetical protein
MSAASNSGAYLEGGEYDSHQAIDDFPLKRGLLSVFSLARHPPWVWEQRSE